MLLGPSPDRPYPLDELQRVGFLKPLITKPNIFVGDYTYYDDPQGPERFETENVLYHFAEVGDKLIIGKFCALAHGVKFIMNGANHQLNGFSTYPFFIFGNGWEYATPAADEYTSKGDTILENDVWLGYEALVMPGVNVGNGAIVASRAVVTRDVPAYTIVAGNPARVVKQRFADEVIAELQQIQWWDWSADKISRHLRSITSADLSALRGAR
jgi:virginiamycin A acetyltransferase